MSEQDSNRLSPELAARLAHVEKVLADAAAEIDAAAAFPWRGIQTVHEAGLLELTVAKRYGGDEVSAGSLARVVNALGRGDPTVALISLMTQFVHWQQASKGLWPDDLYRQILKQAELQPTLLNNARVEPELGSPARGGLPATCATRTQNGWRITGKKRFVTGSDGLSWFLVWASTDEESPRVGTFIVSANASGIKIVPNWQSLGMRGTVSHDVEFNAVEVPHDAVLGLTDVSVAQQDNAGKALANLIMTTLYLGVAESAQQAFIDFAEHRVPANLGYPVARTERFISLAGEIDLSIGGARQLILDAIDYHADDPETLLRARILAGRQLRQAVEVALRALGNPGLNGNQALERHFRNIQSVLVHAPQEDTVVAILGRQAFANGQTPAPSTTAPLTKSYSHEQ